jgi:hypothetical protein
MLAVKIWENMETKNQSFQNSLLCLQHPLSLLGIVILLVNDHVLKTVSWSWLTGKLSDFAGLFFFPFVVATVLSSLLNRIKVSAHIIGQIAFGLVSIWFVLIKLIAPANDLADRIASSLSRLPIRYALDPTDVVALVVMIPAWNLWIKQPQKKPTRVAYFALTIGALAALATSPIERAVTNVTDLSFSTDGILYAADSETFGAISYPIAKSLDGGLTWATDFSVDTLPETHSKTYPIQVCYGSLCYRVTSDHQLEFSQLGQTWGKVFPSDNLSIRANDVIDIAWEGREYVLVAIGKNGVLRRDLITGNWEIIYVINARGGD